MQPGYSLELVVSDPIIQDPAVMVFDGNGRMYVAEMRSYMPTLSGAGQFERRSRVSLHWSSKGDGHFDRHTIFADNLVLPRMILPLDGGVLINETGTDEIWLYRDTNGDGVADKKELFRPGGPRGENLEHQPSGLIWGLDNWLYTAVNPYRMRMRGTNLLGEQTAANFGQWGLSQDDYGKPWFVNAGYEAGPVNIEFPIYYGESENLPKFNASFMEVWPLAGVGDYQGGEARVRPGDKTLNHFTGTCGEDIFRGDRLPAELRGDLFFCEPVGRLIRRARVEVKEGFTTLTNPYEPEHSEFIRSTDPNFRPINLVTAPDGTLYICDMYRGVIQESAFMTPYLRGIIEQGGLDRNLGRGRIWRLVHKDFKPGPQPRLLDEKAADLVKYLAHPNGWWRDTAQKLLVLRADNSVVPALAKMARTDTNHLARIHALWTLEGLEALDPALIREKLADKHPQVRIAAIRVNESLCKAGDQSVVPDVIDLVRDPDPAVVLQVLLTANYLHWPDSRTLAATAISTNKGAGIQLIGPRLAGGAAPAALPQDFSQDEQYRLTRGEQIYKQLCFMCHGLDGKGMPLAGAPPGATMAPPLGGSRIVTGHRDGVINAVLKGLDGPVNGKTYTAKMVPMQGSDDVWMAAIVSYLRNSFGNSASMVDTNDVARVRADFVNRTEPWTERELLATLPEPLGDRRRWKAAAGRNDAAAGLAIDGDPKTRYDTGTSQGPGMWFEVRLPSETSVAGLLLDSSPGSRDYPREYKVEVSSDGKTWSAPVATGHGTGKLTEIVFPPAKAKMIRITLTALAPGRVWAINELQLFKPAPPPPPKPAVAKKPAVSIYE